MPLFTKMEAQEEYNRCRFELNITQQRRISNYQFTKANNFLEMPLTQDFKHFNLIESFFHTLKCQRVVTLY